MCTKPPIEHKAATNSTTGNIGAICSICPICAICTICSNIPATAKPTFARNNIPKGNPGSKKVRRVFSKPSGSNRSTCVIATISTICPIRHNQESRPDLFTRERLAALVPEHQTQFKTIGANSPKKETAKYWQLANAEA